MQYDFNLLAFGGQQLAVKGRFFKYKSGTGAIRVRANNGGYVDLLPGQGVWNVEYSELSVSDISGAANKGVIVAGDFDFRDDRISGTVDVIDGNRTRTLGTKAYISVVNASAPAANYAHVQLFNPANSGVNAFLSQIIASSSLDTAFVMKEYSTAYSNLFGNAKSKSIGSPVSKSELRYVNDPTVLPGATASGALLITYSKANEPMQFRATEPFLIKPGTGISLHSSTQATTLQTNFEFFEEPII